MDALFAGAAVGFALILFHDAGKKKKPCGGITGAALPTANLPGSPVLPGTSAAASGCVGFNYCGCGSSSPRPPITVPSTQNLTPGVSNTGISSPNAQWYYNPAAANLGPTYTPTYFGFQLAG